MKNIKSLTSAIAVFIWVLFISVLMIRMPSSYLYSFTDMPAFDKIFSIIYGGILIACIIYGFLSKNKLLMCACTFHSFAIIAGVILYAVVIIANDPTTPFAMFLYLINPFAGIFELPSAIVISFLLFVLIFPGVFLLILKKQDKKNLK